MSLLPRLLWERIPDDLDYVRGRILLGEDAGPVAFEITRHTKGFVAWSTAHVTSRTFSRLRYAKEWCKRCLMTRRCVASDGATIWPGGTVRDSGLTVQEYMGAI